MKKLFFFIVFIALGGCQFILAQDTLRTKRILNDSIRAKEDSLYRRIERRTQKSKIGRRLHNLLFTAGESVPATSPPPKPKELSRWVAFQGKIIRRIEITTYDPLGFSEQDSTQQPNRWEVLGNRIHNKTKSKIVRRLLLFKPYTPLDSIKIQETARVLRSQYHIRRVHIQPIATHSVDSVDIKVNVLDSWSLYADAMGSFQEGTVRVFERNFLGLGHQLSGRYSQEIQGKGRPSFGIDYEIPNLYATTLNTSVGYSLNFDRYYYKYWELTRAYYSLYTRWAAGAYVYQRTFEDGIPKNDSIYSQNFKVNGKNLWGSVSFPILKHYTPTNRVTNLVFSMRYYQTHYLEKPNESLNPEHFYSDKNTFLASLGVNYIGYEQDRYIFRHQDIEDIPIGKSIALIGGVQENLGHSTPYLAGRLRYGDYFSFGYLASDVQMGSFLALNRRKQATLRWELTYFSPLFNIGQWHFRQFVKWRSVVGFSRKDFIKDRITLNGSTGIIGFNSPTLTGIHKSILTLQTQSYSPFALWGFRVSPFLMGDIGLIGNDNHNLQKDQVLTKVGIGFYITNDYIPLGNFQFSFIYIPRVPGVGNHIQRLTSISNTDFRLPYFNYNMPELIRYE